MSFTTDVHNIVRRVEDLRNPDLLRRFLAAIASQEEGFHLVDLYAEQAFGPWHDLLLQKETDTVRALSAAQKQEYFTPGLSPALEAKVERFVAGDERELVIQAFSVARGGDLWGLDFLITILSLDGRSNDAEPDVMHASVTYKYLDTDGKHRFWESLPLLTYRMWYPLFTCLSYEDDPQTSLEDALAFQFRYLYKINIYSPEVVEHLGRAKLLGTPDATVEELEDGGVFLRPIDTKTVAAYLGMAPA